MRTLIYITFIGLCGSLSAQTTGKQSVAQLKESPAGARIIWFLDAVKAGDVTDELIKNHFSSVLIEKQGVDGLLGMFANIKENDGSLNLYSANRLKMTEYKLKLKGTKSNGWLEMQFYFEDSAPYRIRGFTIDSIDDGNDLSEPIYPKSNE
jgi:hypothetical protein